MRLRIAIFLDRINPRRIFRYLRPNWQYFLFFAFVVLPLGLMALLLAIRSGFFSLSGDEPSNQQIATFLTFIGGGLATAATFYGALLTHAHNARERRRLQLEAVLKSLDHLPENKQEQVAGVLSAMVMLGQQRIALRALQPAWDNGLVDKATATWVIGQVFSSADNPDPMGDKNIDSPALNEAAALLWIYADGKELTEAKTPGKYYFPGELARRWNKYLPREAKELVLGAAIKTLLSQKKSWWNPDRDPGILRFPTCMLLECAKHDFDPVIRSSAGLLLESLKKSFQNIANMDTKLAEEVDDALGKRRVNSAKEKVSEKFRRLAGEIEEWASPKAIAPIEVLSSAVVQHSAALRDRAGPEG